MAQIVANNSSGGYTFSSQPRAVQQRKKYKDPWTNQLNEEEQMAQFGNIMYDRRVIRGNTYALNTLPASSQPDPIEIQKQQEENRRRLARRRVKEQLSRHTPEPVEGRKHIPVQTELYLEELSDRVEEVDVDVQTDEFLDRPPSPLFIPAKTGVDISTQIYDGDLFDFNIEVKPILEVLVGKTIEQSLIEVMEEEELADLRKQQREYEELRNAEKVEQQRLEEQERRLTEEKHRRMKQAADVLRLEKETAEKLAAKAFAKSYLADLVPSVFNNLRDNGYFYDPVHRDLETGFIPWILDSTTNQLNSNLLGRLLVDHFIRNVVTKRDVDYKNIENIILERQQQQLSSSSPDHQNINNDNDDGENGANNNNNEDNNNEQEQNQDSNNNNTENVSDDAQQETSNQQDEEED